jgi:hypothetical protein
LFRFVIGVLAEKKLSGLVSEAALFFFVFYSMIRKNKDRRCGAALMITHALDDFIS